jgi:hypothetical protein
MRSFACVFFLVFISCATSARVVRKGRERVGKCPSGEPAAFCKFKNFHRNFHMCFSVQSEDKKVRTERIEGMFEVERWQLLLL